MYSEVCALAPNSYLDVQSSDRRPPLAKIAFLADISHIPYYDGRFNDFFFF